MPTPQELLKLSPQEIYGQAVRAGIEVAVKRSSIGIMTDDGQDPMVKFYADHPEFQDPQVKPLMEQGAMESLTEILRMASEIPGVVGVFNESPGNSRMLHTQPRNERKRVHKEAKKKRFEIL